MGRAVRWTSAIAVVVLTVLALGVLGGGAVAVAGASATVVAAGESPHECHGAPLQDVEHSAAAPVRAPAGPDTADTHPPASSSVVAPVPARVPPATAGRASPPVGSCSRADLQVFRI